MNKYLVFVILIFLAITSCSHQINSDSEEPIIEDLQIVNPDSINNVVFPAGTNVKFSARFIDNQELGSYKFDIHFAGDGHRHTHIDPKKATSSTAEWDFTKNGSIDGTDQVVSFNRKINFKDEDGVVLDVVANSGPYHCVVYAVDEAGNSASFIQKKFLITNEDMPEYTITEPNFTDYTIAAGMSIHLVGSAYGKRGLSKLAYIIRSFDDEEVDDYLFDEVKTDGSKEIAINTDVKIPSDAPAGKYILLLLASDKAGNVGEFYETFNVSN